MDAESLYLSVISPPQANPPTDNHPPLPPPLPLLNSQSVVNYWLEPTYNWRLIINFFIPAYCHAFSSR